MKLDPRIIEGKKPLGCFETEEAKEFVGKECYFADSECCFESLDFDKWSSAERGMLENVSDTGSNAYRSCRNYWYVYCLPCEWVTETKENAYRPFANTKEFFLMRNFNAGDLIHIRSKADNKEYHLIITGCTDEELILGNLQGLSFNELLQKFELWDCEDNKFIPFGVKE